MSSDLQARVLDRLAKEWSDNNEENWVELKKWILECATRPEVDEIYLEKIENGVALAFVVAAEKTDVVLHETKLNWIENWDSCFEKVWEDLQKRLRHGGVL